MLSPPQSWLACRSRAKLTQSDFRMNYGDDVNILPEEELRVPFYMRPFKLNL